jgi:hypothetical protein
VSGEPYEAIRSYQRIFRPERRLYAIEGRALPVPGGVPLRWLGWALGALVGVIALSSGSPLVLASAAAAAGVGGLTIGDRAAGLLAAAAALAGAWFAGLLLGAIDWPARLVVVPVAVASFATQATPDGRRADRFARSWLALRLAPARRSLGRALPAAGRAHRLGGEVWVAPDQRSPRLRRGRVHGPAVASFAEPLAVRRARWRGRRLLASAPRRRAPRGTLVSTRLAVGEAEVLEVRP